MTDDEMMKNIYALSMNIAKDEANLFGKWLEEFEAKPLIERFVCLEILFACAENEANRAALCQSMWRTLFAGLQSDPDKKQEELFYQVRADNVEWLDDFMSAFNQIKESKASVLQ